MHHRSANHGMRHDLPNGPDGALATLHNFAGSDGATPFGPPAEDTDGNLYGTTSYGGANNTGTVFKLTPPGGNLTTVYSFCSGSGCGVGTVPNPVIQGADGSFYGTNLYTIYKLTPQGVATLLARPSVSEGYGMYSSLVQASNGSFYGPPAVTEALRRRATKTEEEASEQYSASLQADSRQHSTVSRMLLTVRRPTPR